MEFDSPIHSTNQHINQLIFYRAYTNSAKLQKKDKVNISLSQSNIFQKSKNLDADFGLTTFDFNYIYRFSSSIELSFNYPYYFVSKGFLDKPLDFVHTTLGIETTRENEGHKDNQLNYKITDKLDITSSYFVSGNPQFEMKLSLYEKENLYISSNFGIKLPMGKKSDGFTTTKLGFMTSLLIQKDYNNISWLGNFTLTKDGTMRLSDKIISKKMRYFIHLGTKFPIKYLLFYDKFSKTDFIFTYLYSSSPYNGNDKKFNSYTHLLQFAIRNYLKNGEYIDIFFNQNTIPRHNEADVTFGLTYNFNGFN